MRTSKTARQWLVRIRERSFLDKLMLVTGFVSGLAAVAEKFPFIVKVILEIFGSSNSLNLVDLILTPAYANTNSDHYTRNNMLRDFASGAFVLGLFLLLIGCFWFAAFSDKPAKETDRAWDMIKFISGFFIGSLTHILK